MPTSNILSTLTTRQPEEFKTEDITTNLNACLQVKTCRQQIIENTSLAREVFNTSEKNMYHVQFP